MELLLINHPLDCPVCDKGGECPLQNQAMQQRSGPSRRFHDVKRTYEKPIPISSQVLLDRERCVLCALAAPGSPSRSRATRSSSCSSVARCSRSASRRGQRAVLRVVLLRQHRADLPGRRADRRGSTASGPGPFDLVSTPSICEHCCVGLPAAHRLAPRQGDLRRLAGEDARGQRGVELRQGSLGLRVRPRCGQTGSPTPLVRDADG